MIARIVASTGRLLAAGIVSFTVGLASRAWAGTPPCDRAFSYFRASDRKVQWRVYDPTSRSDTLFLTVDAVPTEMLWDTSLTRVDFMVGRTLHRAPWRTGSKDRIVARFPEKPEACEWWFNPDSACWQFATQRVDLHIPDRKYPDASACRYEVWQSSRDGQRWRIVGTDTTVLDMEDCGLSERISSSIRREPTVTRDDFAPPLSELSADSKHTLPPDSMADSSGWVRLYVPLASAPGEGVEMFYFEDASDWSVAGPAWLVNASTASRRSLCACPTESDAHCFLMIWEACGLLLVEYCGDSASIVDARTGKDFAIPPSNARAIMVTPRLHR